MGEEPRVRRVVLRVRDDQVRKFTRVSQFRVHGCGDGVVEQPERKVDVTVVGEDHRLVHRTCDPGRDVCVQQSWHVTMENVVVPEQSLEVVPEQGHDHPFPKTKKDPASDDLDATKVFAQR